MTNSDENVNEKSQFIQFKDRLKAPERDWKIHPISDIPHKLPIAYQSYQNGCQNIYLQSVISNPKNPKEYLHWLAFDIESKDHKNIKENLKTVCNLLSIFDSKGLLTDCHLALTGWGFRLIYPYYIPSEYSKAFIEFVQNFSELGIDAGLNKGKGFIRIAGYRNNDLQSGKASEKIDRHVYFMGTYSYISDFEVSDYITLCTGKPDYKDDMAIIPEILPTRPIPEKWVEFLEYYKRQAIIKGCIWQGYQTAKKGNLTKEQLESVLGDNVSHYLEKESFGFIASLKKCPACNRDRSFITPTGRLKCWHTSCVAGEKDENGKIIGLPASEWNSELAEMLSEIEQAEVSEPENIIALKSIEDVRNDISDIFQTDSDYLITAMPGVGKTTTTLKAIAPKCNDETFLYLTTSHKLCNEIAVKAKELGIENVQILSGRNEKNCKNHSQIQKIAKQGYSIKFTLCLTCSKFRESESIDPILGTLETSERCDYIKQFDTLKKPGLVIAPYQSANFKKVLDSFSFLGALQKMTVIIDENPINAFTEKIRIDSDAIRFFKMGSADPLVHSFYDKLQKVIDDTLERLIQNKGGYDTHARLYTGQAPVGSYWYGLPTLFDLAGITQDEIDAVDSHLDNYDKQYITKKNKKSITERLETESEWQRRLYRENINFNAFKWLRNSIEQKGTAYLNIDSKKVNAKIRYVTFKKNLPDFTGCRLINLDATGNKSELDSLFGRDFQVIDGNVEMPGLKKTWIKLNTGKMKIVNSDDKKIRDILKKSIPYLRTTDQKILILTFKDISDRVLEIAGRLLPDKTLDVVHFGAGRGLNKWQDFDAVICLGWLNINNKDSLDLAQMLYDNDDERHEFVIRTGKNEVLQGVHRIRLIFGNKNIVIIARNWVSELGTQDTIVSSQNRPELFEDAVERCAGWIKRFNCIDRQALYALGICSKKDEKKATAYYQSFKKIRIDKDLSMFRDKSLLKFGKNNTIYSKLIETLSEKYDLPICEIRIETGKWHKSLGSIEDFQKYYGFFGLTFKEKGYRPVINPEKTATIATETTKMNEIKHKGMICKDCHYYGIFNCLRLWHDTKELLSLIYKENQNCEHYIPKEKAKIYA